MSLPRDEPVPERMGHVRIEGVAGHGGMGTVYVGYDERLLRRVAVKTLRRDRHASPGARERLLREARALSRLDHPGICRIHDVVELDGADVLMLEYVEGRSLAQVLAGPRLPRAEALRIGERLAEALAAAHREGVVHRDLKPENVMVTTSGEPRILDFGIARLLGAPAPASAESPDLRPRRPGGRPHARERRARGGPGRGRQRHGGLPALLARRVRGRSGGGAGRACAGRDAARAGRSAGGARRPRRRLGRRGTRPPRAWRRDRGPRAAGARARSAPRRPRSTCWRPASTRPQADTARRSPRSTAPAPAAPPGARAGKTSEPATRSSPARRLRARPSRAAGRGPRRGGRAGARRRRSRRRRR